MKARLLLWLSFCIMDQSGLFIGNHELSAPSISQLATPQMSLGFDHHHIFANNRRPSKLRQEIAGEMQSQDLAISHRT